MELLPVIRRIWRRRILLAAAVVCAVGAFVALGGPHPPAATSGLAWTSVALDTPKSQLVAVDTPGADTLAWRASLLAHLMGTDNTTRQLAQRLGLNQYAVMVVDPTFAFPLVPSALPQEASVTAGLAVAPYMLAVYVNSDALPVISLQAAAPDRASAQRLAEAAVAVLESRASAGGTFSSHVVTGGRGFKLQAFDVKQVAPLRVKELSVAALPTKALAAAMFMFLAVCAGGVLLPQLSRRAWHQRRARPA